MKGLSNIFFKSLLFIILSVLFKNICAINIKIENNSSEVFSVSGLRTSNLFVSDNFNMVVKSGQELTVDLTKELNDGNLFLGLKNSAGNIFALPLDKLLALKNLKSILIKDYVEDEEYPINNLLPTFTLVLQFNSKNVKPIIIDNVSSGIISNF